MNIHILDTFLKRFGANVPEALKIFGLVLKTRAKLRIVDKLMLMYNENRVFASVLSTVYIVSHLSE